MGQGLTPCEYLCLQAVPPKASGTIGGTFKSMLVGNSVKHLNRDVGLRVFTSGVLPHHAAVYHSDLLRVQEGCTRVLRRLASVELYPSEI